MTEQKRENYGRGKMEESEWRGPWDGRRRSGEMWREEDGFQIEEIEWETVRW